MSFQPFQEVDAGPNLPQPLKVEHEGADYFFGRAVREPPDTDLNVLRFSAQDMPRLDVERARIDSRLIEVAEEAPHPEAASSSGLLAIADTPANQWLTPGSPSSQPASVVPRQVPWPGRTPCRWCPRAFSVCACRLS